MTSWRKRPTMRVLTWATLIGVLCGVLGLLEPLEKSALTARNLIRSDPASGEIAIVGIDEKSADLMGRWPWRRSVTASLIDALNEAEVHSIYFDTTFFGTTTPQDDARFIDSLRNSKVPVTLATVFEVNPVTQKRERKPRYSIGSEFTNSAGINVKFDWLGSAWRIERGFRDGSKIIPSFAMALADHKPSSTQPFTIDYSFDLTSIPYVSAADVMRRKEVRSALKGKRIAIALAAVAYGDMHNLPGWGLRPGVYVQLFGAETLKRGIPIQAGWLPILGLTILFASFALVRRRSGIILLGVAVPAIVGLALTVETLGVSVEIMPALSAVGFVIGMMLWKLAKRRGALTNTKTGLPNLEALGEIGAIDASTVVAAKIHNFADIISSLTPVDQPALIDQIVKRLSLGIGGAHLHQGDQGVFVWLSDKASPATADELEGLLAVLNVPIRVGRRSIDLQITFGTESDSGRDISNRVGSALMAADDAFKFGQRWRQFDPALLETAEWRLSLLGQIDEAIDAGAIWVAYQPQLDLRSGRISGAEALVRWTHPVRGNIAPDDFVRIAEQSGRIERLTLFVIEQAIRTAAKINERGIAFNISANLSASLVSSPYFASLVVTILDDIGLPPQRLTLEITETIAIEDRSKAVSLVAELREAGIAISIDDYGTGLSTLDYLKELGADEIKIDKSFVTNLTRDSGDRVMVASTLDLARDLGCRTVAEGVETQAALTALREMGCDLAQGYLIGRPMPFRTLARMLLADIRRHAA